MKIAIIGSRDVMVSDLGAYVSDADEIVAGGAVGDSLRRQGREAMRNCSGGKFTALSDLSCIF